MPTAETSGSRRPPEQQGRAALLAAAGEELATSGVDGLSLRAIARRAGVSHAAPKYHFGDRAGILTALAADGFRRLGDALTRAAATAGPAPIDRLSALGKAYLDFGLSDPTLFELMFRGEQLHPDDPVLRTEQRTAFDILGGTLDEADLDRASAEGRSASSLPLVAWAFVHGLVVLTRDGALQTVAGTATAASTTDLAHTLTDVFTASVGTGARTRPPEGP